MSSSFITQVVMAVLAVGMLFLNVKPVFMKIGATQDSIQQYQEEREKVNEVNNRLSEIVNRINTITASDMKALLTFMPNSIDHIAVTRDIYFMSEQSGVYLDNIKYTAAPQALVSGDVNAPIPHAFAVTVTGSYAQVKAFLDRIEHNNYPLAVYEFKLAPSELGQLKTDLVLITYSHSNEEEGENVNSEIN